MKLAIFDLDNTLYKIPKGFDEAVIANIYKFYKGYFGLKDNGEVSKKIKEFRAEYGSNPRAFYCKGGLDAYFAGIFSSVEPAEYLKKDEGLAERLSKLKMKKAIFTNGPDFFADKVMKALGISNAVDYVQYGNKCEPKPGLGGFRKIMEKFGAAPVQCVMVGDEEDADLAPARRLGMRTVLVGQSDSIYEVLGVLDGKKV